MFNSQERKRKHVAKAYKTDVRNITDDDVEAYYRNNKKKKNRALTAGVGISAGAKLISKTAPHGYITGRHTLYHSTDVNNIDKIKKEGLKAHGKYDPEAYFTNNDLSTARSLGFTKGEPDKAVYLTKNRREASIHGKKRKIYDQVTGNDKPNKRKNIKISIPHDEYKKMNFVDNPELLGAKSKKEYIANRRKIDDTVNNTITKVLGDSKNDNNPRHIENFFRGKVYKNTKKNSRVLPHDLSSKYIKGGEGHTKLTTKEVKDYIKKNPKRVGKGVGLYGLGGLALTSSAGLMVRNHNQKKRTRTLRGLRQMEGLPQSNERQAFNLLDKIYMEKVAGPIGDFVNDVKDAFTPKKPANPNWQQQGVKFDPNKQTSNEIKKYIQSNYNDSKNYYANELGINNPKYLHDDSFINALDAAEQKYGKGFMDYYGDNFYNNVENSLQPKQASDVLNEMYMEKQALSLQSVGNKVRNAKNRYIDLLRGDTMRSKKLLRDNSRGVVKALKDNRDLAGSRVTELQEIVDLSNKNYKNLDREFNNFKKNNNLDSLKQEIGRTKDSISDAERQLNNMKSNKSDFLGQKTKDKLIKSFEVDLDNARKAHEQAKIDYKNAKNDYFEEYNRRKVDLQHADSNLKAKRSVLDSKKQEVDNITDKINKENSNLDQRRKEYGAESAKHYLTVGGTIGAGAFGLNKGGHAIYDKIKGKDKHEGGR